MTLRTVNPSQDQLALSNVFLRQARVDSAGGGYCAKGVANLLEHVGLGCERGHAYTWSSTLPQNGWIKLEGITAENAPPGAVLVYDRNPPSQRNNDGAGGDEFGHVEIVTVDTNGRRQYVSDKARDNWGGTVPQNFVGVYVHPSLHRTTDGINYTPNLEPRSGGTTFASGQSGASRNRSGTDGNASTGGLDPALAALLQNPSGQNPDDPASNTGAFNSNANVSAFLVLAMMISAIYGVEMDTGAPRRDGAAPETDPALNGTEQAAVSGLGMGGRTN